MMTPVWGRLIVLPNDITETDEVLKRAKASGLEIPETMGQERRQHAQIEGDLVAIGGNCFEDWKGIVPKVGDRVIYDKFAGFVKEFEGKEYRIISDTDILAII